MSLPDGTIEVDVSADVPPVQLSGSPITYSNVQFTSEDDGFSFNPDNVYILLYDSITGRLMNSVTVTIRVSTEPSFPPGLTT